MTAKVMTSTRATFPRAPLWKVRVSTWLRSLSPDQREAIRGWLELLREAPHNGTKESRAELRQDALAALDEARP